MKSNIFKLFLILIVALLFRMWFIDKPEGLWNDEYVSWYIASQNNLSVFFSDMLKNCHTPLYYFYLKLWLLIFPDNDLSLRISSVIPSLITVIFMYFAGKEFKDSKLGLLTAFLTAISSFSIYFAQEVRLYSLLMLFCSISLLYFIKTTKQQNKLNFIIFFITNALICALHTLGIIYSVYSIFFLFLYLYKNNDEYKNKLKSIISIIKYISPFIVVALLLTPFWYSILFSKSLSQFWSQFSVTKIYFTFIDYLSPIQTNIVNTPDTFLTYGLAPIFIIFGITPLLIAVYALIKAVNEKNNVLNYILLSCLFFFITIVLISLTGKMILITKYTCEIYPALLLAISFGFTLMNKKKILSLLFILLNIFYLCTAKDSAPKRNRPEGHYAVVSLIENSRLKHNDLIVLTYYDVDKFERYLSDKNKYRFKSINKFNFNYFMFENSDYSQVIKQGKTLYRKNFTIFPDLNLINKFWHEYLLNQKKGDKVGFIFLNTVSFLSNENINDIIDEDEQYNKTPFIFLVFSSLRNNLLYAMKDEYKIDSITQAGDWTLFVFEKK